MMNANEMAAAPKVDLHRFLASVLIGMFFLTAIFLVLFATILRGWIGVIMACNACLAFIECRRRLKKEETFWKERYRAVFHKGIA